MSFTLTVAEEVNQALRNNQPVVALESTVITHGLPYPANVETALGMEQAIREQGAIPATIAVLKGEIHVGLSESVIDELGQTPSARKVSRRDIALSVALKQTGATTVAGTMIVAKEAGIDVFATGGIGGVHRGHPFDVSADLLELGRTPIGVVCAGAKSILDLPLTLEVLETHGVPIIGYQTDSLPSFYSRNSGLPIDQRIETVEEAAAILYEIKRMNMEHGALITVPIPAEYELPFEEAEAAIIQATEEADRDGIRGKAITPYVLAKVVALTEGRSRAANTALLLNNARVGAQIAKALTRL